MESLQELKRIYSEFKSKNLKLDMSRGKPCKEQLDLSLPMLDILKSDSDLMTKDGIDARNYMQLEGISEIREIFAEVFRVSPSQIIVGGNSSLNLMYDTIARGMQFGFLGAVPWGKLDKVKFLCPVPGYDRHFAITELFGIEMINIAMTDQGPDMDEVERLAGCDSAIKGIWCVPRFSNPTGIVYSDSVVKRLAKMKTAAKDFRIFWDNAYGIHPLDDNACDVADIYLECQKADNEDRVFIFSSTSKVTFAGSGVSFFAASHENVRQAKSVLSMMTIGYDKVNQLRHARFLRSNQNLTAHMKKHSAILKPKFDVVLETLEELRGIAGWNKPQGGYFISVNLPHGTAKRVVELAKDVGVIFTDAGATYPYGKDPGDSTLRIAPSMPSVEELKTAMQVFVVCVKIAVEELTNNEQRKMKNEK